MSKRTRAAALGAAAPPWPPGWGPIPFSSGASA